MGKKPNVLIPTLLVALAIPLTIFSVLQQQDNRSKASTNMTTNAGRPFADDSAWNQPIGTNVQLDPKSAEMVKTLAGGDKVADLYEFGTPIYFADASTPKHNIKCTESWGTCGISTEPVPIPDDARQAPGSDGQMVIVDLSARKSYEFWIYKDDKATTNWGGILPLDGDGRGSPENSAIGAGTSRLAGIVRTYEMEQGNIEHALVFSSSYCAVNEIRFPAVKTDGKYSGAGAIPEGARVQLDPSVNVDSLSMSAGEKTVAKALQKYGAYVIDCGGAGMAFQFEHPMDKNDPYPSVGFTSDYYQMNGIPWEKLRVLKEWNSYTPVAGGTQPTTGTQPSNTPSLITPTIYCVGGVGEPPCAPIGTTTTPGAGGGNPGAGTPGVTGGVNPSGGASNPYPSTVAPCASDSSSSVQTNKKGKKKYKRNRGGGFIERFMRFLIWLIEYILRGGNVPLPTDPNNPCPEPSTEPQPSTEPSGGAQPTTSQAPSNLTPTIFGTTPLISPSPSTSVGQVPVGTKEVFVGNYDTGNFSQWSTCQWKGMNSGCSSYSGADYMAKIVNDGAGHETAARYEVRPGDEPDFGGERAEVTAPETADVVEGDERWYEFSVKFDNSFTNPTGGWFIVLQFHSGSGSPPLAINVSSSGTVDIGGDGVTHPNLSLGPVRKGVWTNYVLHAKFSSNASTGFVEGWENGVQTVPKTNRATMSSSSNYMKSGLYRGPDSSTSIVYLDGLRVTAP